MEAKFTPGPWIDDGDEIGVEIMVGGEPCFTPVCTICTPGLYNTSDTEIEEEANKALIMAAPLLFHTLREMVELFEHTPISNSVAAALDRRKWIPKAKTQLEAARAAIAAAEGRP